METGSRVRVKFGDIRWAVIVAGVAGVASALGATGAVQAAGKTQQRGAPAVKVESAPFGQQIIGKWDEGADGCRRSFYEYRADGAIGRAQRRQDGTWAASPKYFAGRYSLDGNVMTSKVEMVDDQGYLEVKQNLRIDGDGRLIRVDVSRVLVNRRDGTRENEELRDQVLARCPDSEVANADVQVEASLAALHQRIAADRAFTVAHPDVAAIRDELLIQMRQIDQLRIGELPIRFANPHHLPLEAAGDGFRLTIPDMSLILGDDRLVIGTVASEFSLLSPHRLTVRSRIPEKITLLTENGQPSIEVVIGSRKFAGTWDRRLQIFTALAACRT